jgi:hypothetical protein
MTTPVGPLKTHAMSELFGTPSHTSRGGDCVSCHRKINSGQQNDTKCNHQVSKRTESDQRIQEALKQFPFKNIHTGCPRFFIENKSKKSFSTWTPEDHTNLYYTLLNATEQLLRIYPQALPHFTTTITSSCDTNDWVVLPTHSLNLYLFIVEHAFADFESQNISYDTIAKKCLTLMKDHLEHLAQNRPTQLSANIKNCGNCISSNPINIPKHTIFETKYCRVVGTKGILPLRYGEVCFHIIPKKHRESLSEVTQEEFIETMVIAQKIIKYYKNSKGFNRVLMRQLKVYEVTQHSRYHWALYIEVSLTWMHRIANTISCLFKRVYMDINGKEFTDKIAGLKKELEFIKSEIQQGK